MRITAFFLILLTGFPALAQNPPPTHTMPTEEAERTASSTASPRVRLRERVFYPSDTERFKPLMRKLGTNVFLDEKDIFTSPFHAHSKKAKWAWIGFGAATAALVATDHKTNAALNSTPLQVRWGNRVSKIGSSYTLIPLVAGFYMYGAWKDEPKPREVGVLGAQALLDGLITVEILKTITSRNRPDSATDKGKFFAGGTSFPSGHTTEMWALASLIAHEYKPTTLVPIIAYGLAGVVSAARFSAQKHYASDILAGAAIGWFIGRYVWTTHNDLAIHHHTWLRPQVVPTVDPGTASYGLALNFGH